MLFRSLAGFESGVNALYDVSRSMGMMLDWNINGIVDEEWDKSYTTLYGGGTDIAWYWNKKDYFADYTVINSFNTVVYNYWVVLFTMVRDANVILSRSEADGVDWGADGNQETIQAYARFFRGLAYRYLVHLFGGVPIIKEEITSPKLDFVRNSPTEIYNFIIEDLEFASEHLPVTNNRDGHIKKLQQINCWQKYIFRPATMIKPLKLLQELSMIRNMN